ncbi:hypothetical protein AX15_002563 [Amanita polypyramis BW_CC]|nr:hypothetical protein AX15_002563 [Amanita polypyramis BW_CC]
MPFIDISCKDDHASIYYVTNTQFNNVSGFDPEKPTVILLHPFLLDSSWLSNQFEDARLRQRYNMIAFDRRSSGKSSCRVSGSHDSWVDAADLAFCHHTLRLSSCHILALESVAVNCALRFALLFPEKCQSLTLCNIPSPTDAKWVDAAYHEIRRNWCFAEDLETLEQAQVEAIKLIIGNECNADLQDELIAYWQTEMPPKQRHQVLETFNVLIDRDTLDDDALGRITQPVLIVHGEKNETYSIKHAQHLSSQLSNAQGGAVLYPVKGGRGALSLVQGSVSIVNQVFSKFLGRQVRVRSDLGVPEIAREERMKMALLKLAEIAKDTSIAKRNPSCPISFSCLSQRAVQTQIDLLAQYREGRQDAFSPVGPDGKPLRMYSSKQRNHWFYAGKDGLSVAEPLLERVPTKFDPDPDKTFTTSRTNHVDERYARKHSSGELNISITRGTTKIVETPYSR